MTDNITNRSGGVDFSAENVNIGNDVVGRDKITTIYESLTPVAQSLHQLPAPPADFTGRVAEADDILNDLQHGTVITSIRGLGGIGKTALALVIADRVKAQYPDAQFFINLQGASDRPLAARDALAHVVRGFHPVEKLPCDEAGLRAQYLSDLHDKRVIILLDDARDAEQVKPLLPPVPCLLLITSRQHFHLPGLHPIDLNTLPPDDARKLLLEIAPRLTNVILSAEGAKDLLPVDEIPRFARNDTLPIADLIAHLCGHLPLALRVAGSFLAERPDFDAVLYVRRLSENRLKQLSEVNSTLQVSYDLLSSELQRSWRQLAVFPADFDRDAAKFVWDVDEDTAQDTLSELVRYSLVEYKTRYHLHDLARLFADTHLSDEERYAAQRCHAEHYLNVLSAANDLFMQGNESALQGLALFDAERTNIQRGQAWATAHADEDQAAAQLCDNYPGIGINVLDLRLHAREQIRWLEASLKAARQLKHRKTEGIHLLNLGVAYTDLGEIHKAIECLEQSLKITRETGFRLGECRALANLGSAYVILGETHRAIERCEQALQIARDEGYKNAEGSVLELLGVAYADLGETRRAIELYEQALYIVRKSGNRVSEESILGNLGIAWTALGDIHKATIFYEQALQIARDIGDKHNESSLLGGLGLVFYSRGETRKAIEFYEHGLTIVHEIDDRRREGYHFLQMALTRLSDDFSDEQAEIEINSAMKIFSDIEDKRGIAAATFLRGGLAYVQHADEKAAALFSEAIAIENETGGGPLEIAAKLFCALLEGTGIVPDEAITLVKEARMALRQKGTQFGDRFFEELLGMLASGQFPQ